MRATGPAARPTALHAVLLTWCLTLVVIAVVGPDGGRPSAPAATPTAGTPSTPGTPSGAATATGGDAGPRTLPGGRRHVFDGRVVVAYYGAAGTAALGVLGEAPPAATWPRLVDAARAFDRPGRPAQPAFELIVSMATDRPGPDGDYSRDVPRATVERYVEAARRHGALLLLDLQTGRSDFLTVAKRWAWALRDPSVGLAIDPEWRVGPHEVPGRVIGHVGAAELNRVSAWLDRLTAAHRLPEKMLVVHQFRTSMVRDIDRVRPRRHLALVQHADGFGPPWQKLATYHAIARPDLFHQGFKLFYDEDVPRMSAARVLRIRPAVEFVSFQ